MESAGRRYVGRAGARVGRAAACRAVHGIARQFGDPFHCVANVEIPAALVRFAVARFAALSAAIDVTATGRAAGAALVHAIATRAAVAALATVAATTAAIEAQHVCECVAEAAVRWRDAADGCH